MWITTNYRILSPPLTSSVTLSKWTSCSTPQLLIWETELTTADDSYNVRMMWRMYTLGSAKSLTHDTLFLECKTPWVKIASLFYGFLIKRKQCLLSYLIMTSLFVWCTPISETLKYFFNTGAFSSVQSLSCVQLFATPWTAACQASLSINNSRSLLKLMSIESVMPSNHLPSLSPPAFNLSQHQSLFQGVSSSHQVAKVLNFQLQHQSFQWIFRTDFL